MHDVIYILCCYHVCCLHTVGPKASLRHPPGKARAMSTSGGAGSSGVGGGSMEGGGSATSVVGSGTVASGSGSGAGAEPAPWPTGADGYKLDQIIGKGAFATVWKAFCPVRGVHVAVKVMDLENVTHSFEDIRQEVSTFFYFLFLYIE